MKIKNLLLTARSQNCLSAAGIETVDQFMQLRWDDVNKIPEFGMKSQLEVYQQVAKYLYQQLNPEQMGDDYFMLQLKANHYDILMEVLLANKTIHKIINTAINNA